MKTTTENTITINGKKPELNSEGRIEVVSQKLIDNPIFNKSLNGWKQNN